jgi:ribosome maturation factor RimP|tara:strand:+ start:589 stop:1305 length:717 start_codon:yes stop_codon:yes gene_type:complete
MNKHSLNRFIDKYYLGGNCSSVVIKSDGTNLSTRFITGDKNLLGELKMSDWKFDKAELGVYNTEQLVKLLSVMSDNISMNLTKAGDKVVSLKVSDSASSVNYMLSDLSVIGQVPNMKSVPDFEVKIKVDKSFMNKFVAGKGALADTDNFTVLTSDDGVKVVIGYAEINTNRVTLPVQTETYDVIDNVSFNANLFRDVLVANKECESATLEVSSQGLARIKFKIDEYDATYYLVAETDV